MVVMIGDSSGIEVGDVGVMVIVVMVAAMMEDRMAVMMALVCVSYTPEVRKWANLHCGGIRSSEVRGS